MEQTPEERTNDVIDRNAALEKKLERFEGPFVAIPAKDYTRRRVVDALLGVVIALTLSTLTLVTWLAPKVVAVVNDTNKVVTEEIPGKDARIAQLEKASTDKDEVIDKAVEYIIARCEELATLGRECPTLTLQEGK